MDYLEKAKQGFGVEIDTGFGIAPEKIACYALIAIAEELRKMNEHLAQLTTVVHGDDGAKELWVSAGVDIV